MKFFKANYWGRKCVEKSLLKFAQKNDKKGKLLDVGCGSKPYKNFFKKIDYIGLDVEENIGADIIAPAWEIPFADNTFDVVLLIQSLEHIEKTKESVEEIYRVLKSGSKVFVSVPHTMRNHGDPISLKEARRKNLDKDQLAYWTYDFWRFTPFGLVSIFDNFEIEEIKPTNGYFTTLAQMRNYFFASLPGAKYFKPIYFVNNILAGLSEVFFHVLFLAVKLSGSKKALRFFDLVYYSLPLNYIIVLRKK